VFIQKRNPKAIENKCSHKKIVKFPYADQAKTRKKVQRLGLTTRDDEAMCAMMLNHDTSKPFTPVSVLTIERHIPMSYKEAVSCPEASFWKEAIKDEHN
jgi:hypothetical protein